MKKITVTVPATIANVGPGFDVLALAVDGLVDQFTIALCEGESQIKLVTGMDAEQVPQETNQNWATIAAHAMAKRFDKPAYFSVDIHRQLPIAGGLGSSAAASLAGALGAAHLLNLPATNDDILSVALESEGHLDNLAAAMYGGMTIALGCNPPRTISLEMPHEWWIAIVTPKMQLKTSVSRAVLPAQLSQSECVKLMALSCGVVGAWCKGDKKAMAKALHDPFAEPRRAGMIPKFYDVKNAALKAGAIGCSISGAGPSVFALCGDELSAKRCTVAMKEAFGETRLSHMGRASSKGVRCE